VIPNTSHSSLLPYLVPDAAGFHLNITTPLSDVEMADERQYAFRVVSDSAPLTRLLRADIMGHGKSTVTPIFLLMQKDQYDYTSSELWPLTNLDIDAAWQQTVDKKALAFQSLFFCHRRHVFFPPSCPICGQTLSVCKDDTLLTAQGLSGYTTSLRRYLHCGSCPPDSGGNGFFAPSIQNGDPAGVRDTGGLIAGWRHLLAGGIAPDGFPCNTCPERPRCYGPENLAALRIVPFSFFPFYLSMLNAMSLSATDFLPLLSGASFEEIESRFSNPHPHERLSALRAFSQLLGKGARFLFEGTPKHFLEVLYLKLSFLNELTGVLLLEEKPLDISTAMDSLWVSIPHQGSLLPAFWNFSAQYIDIGIPGDVGGIKRTHPRQMAYFLGIIWFYALLSNNRQPIGVLINALLRLLEKNELPSTGLNTEHLGENAARFNPENIFWHPERYAHMALPEEWRHLWEKAVGLGWELLAGQDIEITYQAISKKLTALCDALKDLLFNADNAPVGMTVTQTEPATETDNDPAIHRILEGIINKYRNAVQKKDAPSPERSVVEQPPPPPEKPVESFPETVILSKETSPDDLEKTVVIPRENLPEEPLTQTVILPAENKAEELAETVILSPGMLGAPDIRTIPKPSENEEVPCETLIISRIGVAVPPNPPPGPPSVPKTDERGDSDDFLSETVILRPPPKL
jgi:hypothetical protein